MSGSQSVSQFVVNGRQRNLISWLTQ